MSAETSGTDTGKDGGADPGIIWFGRLTDVRQVQDYFALPNQVQGTVADMGRGVVVTECYTPGAFKLPLFVDASIEIGPALDQVRANFGDTVKKILRRSNGKFSFRHVLDEAEILDLEQRMIRPFAARHGADTAHFDSSELMRYARGHAQGRFVALEHQGQVVGCGFGFASYPGGVKTWNACRFGCTSDIFDNSKLLEEVNTQNVNLTTEWARAAGYQSVNLGVSMGRPDSGLVQWKCRRGAYPDASAMSLFVYLRVAPAARAAFFWRHPAFAIEDRGVAVLAGISVGADAASVLKRLRPMAYRRLSAFRVFCETSLPQAQRTEIANMLRDAGMDAPLIWVDFIQI